MLHLILGILKVIGIILLVLLGLVLLAILVLLFVPVRYRLSGKKEAELLEGAAGVSWLLHLVSLTAEYKEKQLAVKLKLFGIPVKPFGIGTGNGKKRKRPKKNEDNSVTIQEFQEQKKKVIQIEEKRKLETQYSDEDDKKTNIQNISIWEKLQDVWEKIIDLVADAQDIPDKLEKSIYGIRKKAEPFLQDETRKLYRRLIERLEYLWKHYRPRKIKGWLHFGTDNPDKTGELTGLIYLLLPMAADQMEIIPDFAEKVLETQISLKGHIRSIHLVKVAILLWWDKEFRITLRRVRGKEEK